MESTIHKLFGLESRTEPDRSTRTDLALADGPGLRRKEERRRPSSAEHAKSFDEALRAHAQPERTHAKSDRPKAAEARAATPIDRRGGSSGAPAESARAQSSGAGGGPDRAEKSGDRAERPVARDGEKGREGVGGEKAAEGGVSAARDGVDREGASGELGIEGMEASQSRLDSSSASASVAGLGGSIGAERSGSGSVGALVEAPSRSGGSSGRGRATASTSSEGSSGASVQAAPKAAAIEGLLPKPHAAGLGADPSRSAIESPIATAREPRVAEAAPPLPDPTAGIEARLRAAELDPTPVTGHIHAGKANLVVGEGAERVTLRISAESHRVKVEATVPSDLATSFREHKAELDASLKRHGLDLAGFSTNQDGAGSRELPSAPSRDPARDPQGARRAQAELSTDETAGPLATRGIRVVA